MLGPAPLRTERLIIRPFTSADAAFFREFNASALARRFMGGIVEPDATEAALLAHIKSVPATGLGARAVVEEGSSAAIGYCGALEFPPREGCQLIYGLLPRAWGRGFATEAARAVVDLFRDSQSDHCLYATIHPQNRASLGVARKLGFQEIGTHPHPRWNVELLLLELIGSPAVANGLIVSENTFVFAGPDVVVRPYRLGDESDFARLVSDPQAMAPLGGPARDPASLFRRLSELAPPNFGAWAVVLRGSGEFIGHIFVSPSELAPEPELGFVFRPQYWCQGLGSQAVAGLVETLRANHPEMRLSATVDVENVASQRILERVGLALVATRHDDEGPYLVYSFAEDPSLVPAAQGETHAELGALRPMGAGEALREHDDGTGDLLELIQKAIHPRGPGASYSVSRDRLPVLHGAVGLSGVSGEAPLTTQSTFRTGSVAKMFTSALTLRLSLDGRVRIDDSIRMYLPEAPSSWEPITVRHILAHRSGLSCLLREEDGQNLLSDYDSDGHHAWLARRPLAFVPGTAFQYSNSAYVLLAETLSRHLGVPFSEMLKEEVLLPLGLESTCLESASATLEPLVQGYELRDVETPGLSAAQSFNPRAAMGAGDLLSCVTDLRKFAEALSSGEFIPAELAREAWTDGGSGYGLGFRLWEHRGRRIVGHSGICPGFSSFVGFMPEDGIATVVLSNAERAEHWGADALGAELAFRAAGVGREAIQLSPGQAARYVGSYAVWGDQLLNVTAKGTRLFINLPGQPPYPVLPIAPHTFVLRVVERTLRFKVSNSGVVSAASLGPDSGPRLDN